MKKDLEAKFSKAFEPTMDRDAFMAFFRDEGSLNTLSTDDRYEIFQGILLGSSDITKKALDELINNYNVHDLEVVEKIYPKYSLGQYVKIDSRVYKVKQTHIRDYDVIYTLQNPTETRQNVDESVLAFANRNEIIKEFIGHHKTRKWVRVTYKSGCMIDYYEPYSIEGVIFHNGMKMIGELANSGEDIIDIKVL
jgi:hypothetical protein